MKSAHLALLAMVVIWGVNFSVAKVALVSVSPLAFNALRFPLAALLLVIMLRMRGGISVPARADWPRIIALGVLGNVLYQIFFIFGLDRTTAGNASLLLAGTPIMTALLSAAVGQERVRPRVWVGVIATFTGIVLIVLGAARAAAMKESTMVGDLLMLSASTTWAVYTVGSRPLVDRYGAVSVTAWTIWIGTIGVVSAGLPDLLRLDFARISFGTWAAIAYAGMLSLAVAYTLFYFGVRQLGNTRASTYSNIVPAFALLAAWLWLGEIPKAVQVIGAVIIIGGVSVAQSGSLSPAPDISPEV